MSDFAKDLEIASDPSTEPEILATLERSPHAAVREAVASNPNTPAEVLLRLGAEFPTELLNNPLFNLLLLENPNLVSEIPLKTLQSLVKQENVPIAFVEYALKGSDRESWLAITLNPNLPQQVLERLIKVFDRKVTQAVKLHVNWFKGTPSLDIIEREVRDATTVTDISYKDLMPLKWLAKVAAIPDFISDCWLKQYLNKSPEHHLQSDSLAPYIYSYKKVNFPILEKLVEDSNWQLRRAIALNPLTPVSTLEKLARDKHQKVRQAIAVHPLISSELLEKLASDPLPEIRQAIAKNPNTPPPVLYRLSRDIMFVRRGVAENLNTPPEILKELTEIPLLRCSVLRNPNCPQEIRDRLYQNLNSLSIYERLEIAKNPLTPSPILDKLARDRSLIPGECEPKIPEAVALNPNTHLYTFEKMARDTHPFIKNVFLLGFESNPNITSEDLIRLSQDEVLKYSVAAHSQLPLDLMENYFNTGEKKLYVSLAKNSATTGKILEKILGSVPSTEEIIYQLIAKHPNTPSYKLELLSYDKKLHDTLIKNPNLPIKVWERLLPREQQADRILPLYLERNCAARSAIDRTEAISWALRHFTKFNSNIINLVICSHPQADPEFLTQRANSIYWLERWAVAQNPNTPQSILEKLSQDANIIVRQRALGIANLKYKSEC